jgi:hypothetical protein
MRDERDDEELDRYRRGDEAGEEPEHDANRADRLKKEHRIGSGQRGLDPPPGHAAGGEGLDGGCEAFLGHRHHLEDPVDQQHSTCRKADEEP